MLIFKITLFMLFPILIYAGSFGGSNDKDVTYDPGSNLIYIGINEISKKDKVGYEIVNFVILNPENDSKTFVFPKGNQKTIKSIFFETMYDSTGKRMVLNVQNDFQYSFKINPDYVVNNELVEKRAPKDKLLFVVNEGYNEPTEIWTSLKNGKELKKIINVAEKDSWHIDIRNCKIRIITQKGYETSINQYDW